MEASSLETQIVCRSCQKSGSGVYCGYCSQKLDIKRITFGNLVHEVFHFFTHLDKGFPYTLKKLFNSPGKMQREYVEGIRTRHQKPFAMFFICASAMALILYWINVVLANYFDAGNEKEALFFNKYMVMLLIGSLPVTALITYVFFFKSPYNFAEIGVLALYTLSAFFLIVITSNLLKFIWHDLQTRYLEFPVILIYNTITFINFFHTSPKWKVGLKALICGALFFGSVAWLQDYLVDIL
jgi:hypothetical protein